MSGLYITPDKLPIFYDSSRILQLCVDGDDDDATATDLNNTASSPYAIAIQACRDASSDIDQHCQQGRRYTRTDLEAIISAADTDDISSKRAAALQRLAADLAFYYLMTRRGFTAERMRSIAPRADAALETLEQLASGQRVLDLDSAIEASGPQRVMIGSQRYTPSANNRMFGVWYDGPFGSDRLWGC